MRAPRMVDLCRGVQTLEPDDISESWLSRTPSRSSSTDSSPVSSAISKLPEPCLLPCFKPVDYPETLADIFTQIESALEENKSALFLEQSFVFRGLDETKLARRSLRAARQHARSVHEKVVYSTWLKYEKRDEDFCPCSAAKCNGRALECPLAARIPGADSIMTIDPCLCQNSAIGLEQPKCSPSDPGLLEDDVIFRIKEKTVACHRKSLAALSPPFQAMLYGCFSESRICEIDFSHNGISAEGMAAVSEFSKTGSLRLLSAAILLELLSFSNRFCCESLKIACDKSLAGFVLSLDDAVYYMDFALEECAPFLATICLQFMLWELPSSLQNEYMVNLFSSKEGRKKLKDAGHSSYALYSLLAQIAMEEDFAADLSFSLLEALNECAVTQTQKALVLHQLGCVMLARNEYREAQKYFELALEEGHTYSLAGVARAKYKRGHYLSALKDVTSLLSGNKLTGWMYQEKALYSEGSGKLADLNIATDLDPTLAFPYKYRSAALMDEGKLEEAVAEINRILSFKVTADCLEMRAYICLDLEDYQGALRDIRAILTLEPGYMLYGGRVSAEQLLFLLRQHVEPWSRADCWVQLYDRWSSVDDIGSLAVVHQMLDSENGKGLLYFRQSLLLLRLNCPRAAMRSLSLARKYASSEQERLVYEGWILYDTGHREEALKKAEKSIAIQRSFEAFFLKAYALADTSLDPDSSLKVITLLEEALKCPSDGLRKGQALNNLGSVYVDSGKLDIAADCYLSALEIRHTRAHQGLARVHYLKHDKEAAYQEMTLLIQKAWNNASAYEKRSEYCHRDMAQADLRMATQLDPLRTYPYRYRAAVLMDDHKEGDAIAELSRAIAFKPDLQLLHLRAAFYESIEDFSSSIRDCRAALSIDSNHLDTLDLYNRVRSQDS